MKNKVYKGIVIGLGVVMLGAVGCRGQEKTIEQNSVSEVETVAEDDSESESGTTEEPSEMEDIIETDTSYLYLEEQVLFDKENVKVTLCEETEAHWQLYISPDVKIENNSDRTVLVKLEDISLNGYDLSEKEEESFLIPSGEEKVIELRLDPESLYESGMSALGEIELDVNVYSFEDEMTYYTLFNQVNKDNYLWMQEKDVVIQTSQYAQSDTELEYLDDSKQLLEDENLLITYKYVSSANGENKHRVLFYFENKGENSVRLHFDELQMDGEIMYRDMPLLAHVKPGQKYVYSYSLYGSFIEDELITGKEITIMSSLYEMIILSENERHEMPKGQCEPIKLVLE